MKKELPLSLKLIRGAIGKEFVIKHYKDGAVWTKYPDMSGIVASARQRKCRNLFKEAVAYAKEVLADNQRKTCWQKRLRKRNAVYNAAIRAYMLREKKAKQNEFMVTNSLLRNVFKQTQVNHDTGCSEADINDGKKQPMPANQLAVGSAHSTAINKKYFESHTTFDIKTAFIIFNST